MSKKKKKIFVELSDLKGRIRAKGTSYRLLAQKLGIATATFSNKINGFRCFDAVQIDILCDLLDINEDEAFKIFFPHKCSKYTKSA